MEFISPDMNRSMGNVPIGFLPSQVAGLKMWTRFNSGITITGSGVSQWDDVSGNGNHLKQTNDAKRMTKESDGSILGNGIDQSLKTDAFTFVQPEVIFILGRHITWAANDSIFDGNSLNSGRLFQVGTTPNVRCYAGANGANSTDLILNAYSVIMVVFDHDNTINRLKIDNNAEVTDTAFGTADMGGFTLGVSGDGSSGHSNFQAKEIVALSAVPDAVTEAQIRNYLAGVGGLSI